MSNLERVVEKAVTLMPKYGNNAIFAVNQAYLLVQPEESPSIDEFNEACERVEEEWSKTRTK